MSHVDTEIITPATASQWVDQFDKALAQAVGAYRQLAQAETQLKATFGAESYHFRLVESKEHYWEYDDVEKYIASLTKRLTKQAWSQILQLTGVRKLMSNKRIEELQHNLDTGKFPDLTVENILDLFIDLSVNAADIRTEVIIEAYNTLRPRSAYKTNSEYKVGGKVILAYAIADHYYPGDRVYVNHNRAEDLISIDKAFHLLDGKGVPDGYRSPLVDGIQTCGWKGGETEYFTFRPYRNRNLHLTFKRQDLVDEFNRVAGASFLANQNA